MYFRFCHYIIIIALFSAGCATVNKQSDSMIYEGGAFSKSGKLNNTGLNSNFNTDILVSNSNLGYFLLEPDDQTWKAYYYFFRIRNQLFDELVGQLPSFEEEIPVRITSYNVCYTKLLRFLKRYLYSQTGYIVIMRGNT